jgi:DNA-binding XRE family transcriptional regulator
MDVATSVEGSNQSQIAQEIGVSLLRKQLDTAQSSAAQLLQVLPQTVSLEPDKGSMFDSYA